MQIFTLAEKPQYYTETLKLIEKNFQYQAPHHFQTDFAPLMHEKNREHNYILLEEKTNMLIGHIGVRICNWQEKQVAFIGGIAISEIFQRRGFFKIMFEYILKQYEKKVYAFALWSDLHEMYKKYGFYPLPKMIQTGNKHFIPPLSYQEKNFSNLKVDEFLEIQNLYDKVSKTYLTLKRTSTDWEILCHINSTRLFVHYNAEKKIDRYFCVDKGMDLNDIIHEFGFLNQTSKDQLFKDLASFKFWLPFSEKKNFPQASELILALVKGPPDFFESDRLYLSGLDSI